ncbi:-glutamine gamma-glutamyltransferase 6 isoform X2 [Pelobates cultripes]|uniref:protein-glutamine gamma-glutamyltransferase n=1 Tax=Pelobates cultripes TaxID=61616 RepID=A0AAD1WFP1_PELCU|nr:-glutamine gamma-glutamyltransferase 6 isoform X2 [Pelobates cultripes]
MLVIDLPGSTLVSVEEEQQHRCSNMAGERALAVKVRHSTSNLADANTDMYNTSDLVLRRGQSFLLTLEFTMPIEDWQSIVFNVQTGPQNAQGSTISVEFALSNSWTSGMWCAVLESRPGNNLQIIMSSPANAIIGRYNISVSISIMGETTTYSLGKFILLFNPWCLDDDVYMANEDERKEYVLNDHGIIFMGNEKHVSQLGWNYGQFENNILNICMDILDRNLNYYNDPVSDCSRRNSPVYVGRVVSAMINSNEDFGVLEGKWDKDFADGVDPNSWNGSVEILWSWQKDDYKPVKYGQCWVFAAVMCTVLRCLGIPTRVITNFNSAHNTDGNMNVDMHYDTEGKFLEIHDDSIWNFHVWNECWFLRRDIGYFYSGWQVLDSTPQEESQGVHRCGPTSVIAVKEGDVNLGYDTPFVFAEVNADRVTWIVHKDGSKEKAYTDSKFVGQCISTKAIGSDARVDVTHNYKFPEGSPQEREVFEKASQYMSFYKTPLEITNFSHSTVESRTRDEQPAQPTPALTARSLLNPLLTSYTGNTLPSIPERNTLPPVDERNTMPSMSARNGLPPRPGRNGLPSRSERNGLPSRPGRNAFSPERRAFSPGRNAFSPERSAFSPERRPFSPERRAFSPERSAFSPERSAFSPERNAFTPERNAFSPARRAFSPDRNAFSPESSAGHAAPTIPDPEIPDISGKFKILGPLVVGDDINLILLLKNLTPFHKPIKVNLSASCILYTGRRLADIFTDQKSLVISPSQDAHVSVQIPYSQYQECLNNGNRIQVVALCELPVGNKVLITKDLVLENPPIYIKAHGNPMLHKLTTLEIRFRNPLSVPVKDCSLLVEGSGLVDRQLTAVVPFLKPKEKIRFKVELTPYRSGTKQLIVNFRCKYFSIKGYKQLDVASS